MPAALKAAPEKTKSRREHFIFGLIIAALALAAIFEAVIIFEQKRVNERIEAQSNAALGKFLKQGHAADTKAGTDILFRNVRFCWSPNVCINTRQLTATALPLNHGRGVVFDNLKSFLVQVHNADVLITPKTLQGMFNESVFNYPGSKLRNLTVGIEKTGRENHVKLAGSLDYIFWIPFEMDTNLSVDRRHNDLVISVNTLKVFGFIPATWLLQLKPFNLDKLLPLPANQYLTVHHNLMLVKPFGLFPPPRINGKMDSISVMPAMISLRFNGQDPQFTPPLQSGKPNFIYLQGGNAQFGQIQMLDTHVQVNDQNPGNLFQFSLMNYLHYLPLSQVKLLDNGAAVLQMPDHRLSDKT
jgi:hypothetical protein